LRAGIMQPYYFPYAGYISLLKHVDIFVLFDVVQFIHHGWIERNRILKPKEGWQYIQVPLVKHSRETKILDIKIRNTENWQERTLAQLVHYKKRAPHYAHVIELLKELYSDDYEDITSLNKAALEAVCRYLGINTPIVILSKSDIQYEEAEAPGLWALNLCKSMEGIDEYWNLSGGIEYFDRDAYENNGIKLQFHKINLLPYNQRRGCFEPGLSILDMMMFLSKDEINQHLDTFDLI